MPIIPLPSSDCNLGIVLTANSAAYLNFFARVPSLDATHQGAYADLLNGLTSDGLFNTNGTSSFFDALYIFATQSSSIALLNLVSSSFTGTANGNPTFTTDRGFTGTDGGVSNAMFIDTGFNPTVGSPNLTQNSTHTSVWSNTNGASSASGGAMIGLSAAADAAPKINIFPEFSDGNAYWRSNDNPTSAGIANANSTGHYLANRNSGTTEQGYKNAVDQGITSQNSGAVNNGNIYILAYNNPGTGAIVASGNQCCMASIGGSLTATQVTKFYNRLRTYMNVVGVP